MQTLKRKTIYFDNAAGTPIRKEVLESMRPYLEDEYGNPSSLHQKGLDSKFALDQARFDIARLLGANSEEIIFTSGGTESCNLAILGAVKVFINRKNKKLKPVVPHIIISSVEHHAVLEPVNFLKTQGCQVTFLAVDKTGLVNIQELEKAVKKNTVLVSVMYANNEVGTIQPVATIGKLISKINRIRSSSNTPPVLFHTDACQAAGYLDINVNRLQVDLMSINSGKIYGPKGAGLLYVRKGTNLQPIIYGGGQERFLRSGTENLSGIVGMARALNLAQADKAHEVKRLSALRNRLVSAVLKSVPHVQLTGADLNTNLRLPSIASFIFEKAEGESLVLYLDALRICVSTGSACSSVNNDSSHVLRSMGYTHRQAKGSLRVSLGKYSTKNEVMYLIKVLPNLIKNLKSIVM